uniref:Prolyl 4-hydroxylase alpha subunit Fe(2+) 2OG dioxygenase domain-containing protein n=1 Tax=viral metagenome TaxID=1070528 RepID=A0A6C0E9S9_9ZZZZ
MSKYNLLQYLDKSNTIIMEQYPIIIIKNALPHNLYEELLNNYPSISDCFKHDPKNHKIMIPNTIYEINCLESFECFSDKFKTFIEFHTSENFSNEIVKIFKTFPENNNKMFKIDCFAGYNSPVIQKLNNNNDDKYSGDYIGLYFLRKDNDNSKGGSIEFYDNNNDNNKTSSKILTIPYQKNCFILFKKSKNLICKWTDIEPTLHCRRIIKIVSNCVKSV